MGKIVATIVGALLMLAAKEVPPKIEDLIDKHFSGENIKPQAFDDQMEK
jgi:hypothetical protein